jgi:colanic acid biosynthesis glycosyl transferase WcaI
MRFLFLTQYYPPEIGATPVRLFSVVQQLRKFGHYGEVVTAMPNHLTGRILKPYIGHFYIHENLDGVDVHRTWVMVARQPTFGSRILNYMSFALTSLWGLAKAKKPDFLFVESPPLLLVLPAFVYSFLKGVPIILNVADLWPDAPRRLKIMKSGLSLKIAYKLESWAYSQARFINAVTEGIAARLKSEKRVPPSKLLFLPNGVDTQLFAPRHRDKTLESDLGVRDKKVFLYAGTHGLAYRLDLLIEVAHKLRESDIAIVLVGDGFTKHALVELAAGYQLSNVIFVGPQPLDMISRFFSLARASVIPLADNELLDMVRPAKLFPSLASGVPIVYSGRGEGAKVVEAAKAGIVVEPGQLEPLVQAVKNMAGNDSLHSALSQNAREYSEAEASWSAIVDRWLRELASRESEKTGAVL